MRNDSISFLVVMALAGAALWSTGCEGDINRGPLRPSRLVGLGSTTSDLVVGIRTTPVVRRSVEGAQCPFRQPFSVPLDLVFENASPTMFLNQVGFQFIDERGTAGPQIVTTQPTLERQFGHVGLPVDNSRVFPFSFEFGCGTLPNGKIHVSVQMIDGRRTLTDRSLTVPVR